MYCIIIIVSNQDTLVNICWIPSHFGIHGNNEADKAAKSALEFKMTKFKIPFIDFNISLNSN